MNESYFNELYPEQDGQTPKGIETETLLTPDTFVEDNAPITETCGCGVSPEEVEEAVLEINPDINSMESRG
ncbi:MAG: hypothetical protein LUF87_01435 [Alistipes sp.]|nr:hypothetical protein [Alistipes sp.]